MLLEGDAQSVLGLQFTGRLSVDLDVACGWFVEAGQQMQYGAFAAARGTDEGYEFAVRNLHIDRAQSGEGLPAARSCPLKERSCHIA
jgi:hypothetical protein